MSVAGSPWAALTVEVEARAAGFDETRLERIDRHFGRYVEDGRLPGWLLLISRGGNVVHLSTRSHRDKVIDPSEELIVVFLTQLHPSTTYPLLRSQLRQLVYQALVD